MRLVAGLVAVLLSGSLAFANDEPASADTPPAPVTAPAKASKPSLRVVRVMADTSQALLFDKATGKHVLVEIDTLIHGYTVDAIEDDAVILRNQSSELVLSAPERPRGKGRASKKNVETEVAAAPADPYADEAPTAEPVREVSAPTPIAAGEGGVRVADASPTDPYAAEGAPATPDDAPPPALDEEPAPPPAPVTPTVISKSELNKALGDFSKLTSMVRGSFTEEGVTISAVAPRSVFAQAGLQAGDTIVAVDQTPLRSLDDAAELYARAGSTKAANIQLVRAGQPLTLRVLFH